MPHPFNVVRDFETELCRYTGARYAVAVNSCTMALLLACARHGVEKVTLPKYTYVGVPQSVLHAGGTVEFEDCGWTGEYQLKPYPIWDSARRFTGSMYRPGKTQCVSFHASKILSLEQGGAILHDDWQADNWYRKARFDGRTEGVHPRDDAITRGWHCYMSPSVAAQGLLRLYSLPKKNADLPNSDYSDLSLIGCFR